MAAAGQPLDANGDVPTANGEDRSHPAHGHGHPVAIAAWFPGIEYTEGAPIVEMAAAVGGGLEKGLKKAAMAMWSVQDYTDAIEGIVASDQYSADKKVVAVECYLERTRRVKLGAIEEVGALRDELQAETVDAPFEPYVPC